MTRERLIALLTQLRSARIGVIGDFCLDAYWQLDTGRPGLSIETGKPTRAVRAHRYSLGGAGNVVSNLVDLGVINVYGFSVINNDIFGREMIGQLRGRNVDTYGMVIQTEGWDTPVYAKPYLDAEEQERIDFGRWNSILPESEIKLTGALRTIAPNLDALIVNQQLTSGVYSDAVIGAINAIARDLPGLIVLLDSRNMSDRFEGMIAKLNAGEAARVCGRERSVDRAPTVEELSVCAKIIAGRNGKPVFITRSEAGISLFDGKEFTTLRAIPVSGPTDPVGAGDTTVSAIAAALAAGAPHVEAGELGNLAAAVTVKKLRQTGTASPAEILEVAARVGDSTG